MLWIILGIVALLAIAWRVVDWATGPHKDYDGETRGW